MITLSSLVERAAKFSLGALEEATGLSRRTVYELRLGKQTNPRLETLEKFTKGVEDLEAEQTKGKMEATR